MIPTIKKNQSHVVFDNDIDLKASAQDLSLQEVSDETLMLAYANNDQLAFNKLYERYRVALYRYMFKQITVSEAILNELYQDVWLKLINSRQQYKVKASFKTFLYQIANNTLKDYFRRESVRKIMSNIEDDTQLQDPAKLPEDRVLESELMEKFRQVLNELPQDQRDVFLLREEAGLTSVQIAEVMQVSLDTVKSRMRYAVSRLKEIMD
ncbi:MAG: sigma-70 family RNA polymerase sigma factor [Gammaproteobacteria bacterium]|nr:sigma-70 family RNA polymerase sigma factor [Gammaproteobacteria bacterium]